MKGFSLAVLAAVCLSSSHLLADPLAASHQDFSATAQEVGGWSYGYYLGADDVNGAFTTSGMSAQTDHWRGSQTADGTPAHSLFQIHPAGGSHNAVVRRYTVGPANGEPSHSGEVRIVGRFFDLNDGTTDVFIAVDSDGSGAEGRTFPLPASAADSPAPPPGVRQLRGPGRAVSFDITTTVAPGATIDFGALALGSYYSDATGVVAWIVTGDTAVPTGIVANCYGSTNFPALPEGDARGAALPTATDGVIGGTDETTFDTTPGSGFPYQHAGLLYLENAGSGRATRFDSVRIDVTTGADFSGTPRLYLLRKNVDPNTSNPAADDRYARLAVAPVRTTNAAGQPSYAFDLSPLTEAESTGYGFAIVGSGNGSGGSVAISEISAVAVRVSDAGVLPTEPFYLTFSGNRYAFTTGRHTWTGAEAEAVSLGGHLVAIGSAAENQFLVSHFGGTEILYIGLSKPNAAPVTPSSYAWSNGDALTYQNWLNTQPDDFQNENDYVQMNYLTPGQWANAGDAGYPPPGGNFRGIVELTGTGSGTNSIQIPELSARANIFDAGLASATQGGVLPPSIDLTAGGNVITFPQIVGLLNTAADASGPDGAHTAGRSVNLTGVGGISGYLNGNNTPALVGVFLGAAQPSSQPARLDFSTAAIGEDFTALSPALGQVFFIGDGLTSSGIEQQFFVPAGATRLFLGFADGNTGTLYHGVPLGYGDNTGTMSVRAVMSANATPVITTTTFPGAGGQLEAGGGTGPYTFARISGNLPPHLTLNADGTITASGQPRANGTYTFTVRATDAASATGDLQFTVVIADPIAPGNGIVAWWPGENAVADVVGGRHGSLKNSAPFVPHASPLMVKNSAEFAAGNVGRAFAFDGTNDYLEVADHDSLDLTGDLTIEAWVKATATSGERTIVSKRNGDNADVTFVLFTREGILRFAARTGGGSFFDVSSGVAVPAGWSHVAVTITGSSLKFLVNGTEVAATSAPSRPATSGPLTIGATVIDASPSSSPDGPWSGAIDELTLYNRGLTNAEIAAIHSAGAAGKIRADNARDFSKTQNPAGVWSYREVPAGASLTGYDPAQAALMPTASNDFGGRIDFWAATASLTHNNSDDAIAQPSGGSQYDWLPGAAGWGPGSGSQRPVYRWTAPAAGRYAVSANFTNADSTPTSTDVHVRHNTTALFDGIVSTYRGDGLSSTTTITAAAGDAVDFILGTNGNWTYDSAQLAASVVSLGSLPEIVQTEFPEDTTPFGIPWKLTATGGTAPYTFAVVNGELPGDIVLEAEGDITGALAEFGHFVFTIEVTDAAGLKSQRAFDFVVAQEVGSLGGITSWFPGELHVHDVIVRNPADTDFGVEQPGTTFVPGKVGRALQFDGVEGAVEVQSADLNALPLTIETWIKPELRSGNAGDFWPTNIVSGDRAYSGGHGIGANVFADGSHLWIEVQHADPAQAFRRVPGDHFTAGAWAHVALVLTPGNAKTYVNGALVDDFNFEQGEMDADPFFRIGRHNEDAGYPAGQRFFKGAIDELSTYNRALSAAEILAIYNADSLGKTRDDAERDFFTQTNDAGQLWQYGRMGTGLQPLPETFTRYTTVGSENALRFWRDGAAPDPNVIKNRGDQPYLHWKAGELSLHPGPGPERIFSAVRWTAPESGTYAAFAQFRRLNTQAGTVSVHLAHNAQELQNATLVGPGARTQIGAARFVQAGDTIDFIVGSRDDFGFDATGISPSVVLLEKPPTSSPVTSLDIQTVNPPFPQARWHFTATRVPDAADVSLALQYTTTPNDEASWQYIAAFGGSAALVNNPAGSEVWTNDPFLTLAPGGYYFRVETTAPGYDREVTAPFGNEALLGGTGEPGPIVIAQPSPPAAVTNFSIITSKPAAAGKKWVFKVDHADTPGLRLLVQYSLTPGDPSSWRYLPGKADMDRPDPTGKGNDFWDLTVSRLSIPGGKVFFRIVSLIAGAPEGYSAPFGAASIKGAKPGTTGPIVVKNPAALTLGTEAHLLVNNVPQEIPYSLVHEGELVRYTINYRNHGEAPARDVTLTVKWAKEFEAVGATGQTEPIYKTANKPSSGIVGVKINLEDVPASQSFASTTVTLRVKSGVKKPGRGAINLLGTVLAESPDFPDGTADLPFLAIVDPLTVALRLASTDQTFPKGAEIPFIFAIENKSPVALTNATGSVKIPAGAYVENFIEDADTDVERVFDKVGKTVELKFAFGALPANTGRFVFITLRTPFDLGRDTLITGNPTKNDPGYTFTAINPATKKQLVATGESLTVYLSNNIVRPPQLDLGKDVEGATLDGRRTHGIYRKVNPDDPKRKDFAELVRGALVAPGGEVTFNVSYRNVGEGTAKAVEIFDDLPLGCTLVPESLLLNGQPVANSLGGTVKAYDSRNKPIGPNEVATQRDVRTARRFTISVGDLGAGQGGVLSYRVIASSYSKGKFSPLAPGKEITVGGQKFGTPLIVGGGTIFTESLTYGASGSPNDLAMLVVKPHEFRLDVKKPPGTARPGNSLRFAVKYSNAGQLPAYGAFLDVPIPVGTTASFARFLVPDTGTTHTPVDGEDLSAFAGASGTARIQLGKLDPGETGEIELVLQVSTPLHTTLDAAGEVILSPRIDGYLTPPSGAGLRMLFAAAAAPAGQLGKLVGVKSATGSVRLATPTAPQPFIGRTVPMGALKGGTMDVTVFFGNAGDTDATGGNVAMQIPYETTFVSATPVQMTRPADPTNQLNLADTRYTLLTRIEKRSGSNFIVLDLPSLPAHSTGCFTMTLQVAQKFGGAAVEDSSCRIKMAKCPEVVAIPFATHIRSAEWYFSIFESIGPAFSSFGSWVGRGFKGTVQEEFKQLTKSSVFSSCAGLDAAVLRNGVIFAPLRFNRSLIVGPSNLVAAGGGNLVAAGGLNLVAAGGGNMTVRNPAGIGAFTPSQLCANIPTLVAAGGLNLVAAGGGNLVGNDGSTLVGNDGSTLVGNDGASLAKLNNASLVGLDGGSLGTFSANGSSFGFTPVGGSFVSINLDAARLVAAGGGNLVAAGGGNIVSASKGLLVAAGGGNLVAAGGGNLVAAGGLNNQ